LHCLTIGLLHTLIEYVFEAMKELIMNARQILQSTYRNIPTFAKRLLANVTIAGIAAIEASAERLRLYCFDHALQSRRMEPR
jgi:hypothetical protein